MNYTIYRLLYLIARNLLKYTLGLPILLVLSIFITIINIAGSIFSLLTNVACFLVGEDFSVDDLFIIPFDVLIEIWKPVGY